MQHTNGKHCLRLILLERAEASHAERAVTFTNTYNMYATLDKVLLQFLFNLVISVIYALLWIFSETWYALWPAISFTQ